MKTAIVWMIIALSGSTLLAEEISFEGHWSGRLREADGLRLVFHLTEHSDGTMTAKLDSPDQNVFGIPVRSVTNDGKKWTIKIDQPMAQFEGTEDDSGIIQGTWSQGPPQPLTLKRIDGKLEGALVAQVPKVVLTFRISKTAENYSAKLDILEQGAKGIPVDSVIQNGDAITMQIKAAMTVFKGKLIDDSIEGHWMQGGVSVPVTLKRSDQ